MRKIRIARNTVGFRSALFRFNRLLMVMANVMILKPAREAERERLAAARILKVRADTELARVRLQKVSNDVVLGDLKIEEKVRELGGRGDPSFPEPDKVPWRKPGG